MLTLPIEHFTLYIGSLTRLEASHMHFLPLIIEFKRYTFGRTNKGTDIIMIEFRVTAQTLLHKEALLGKNKIMY